MTLVNGRLAEQTASEIMDALMADAKEYFGPDLNDNDLAVIRIFYRPIAQRLAEAQTDIGLVLDSAQIDYADGQALELLTALIGIRRQEAGHATGTIQFSRDAVAGSDYSIPAGTIVQTDSSTPVQFETTDSTVLASGTTSTTAPIQAVYGGVEGNVGANTITVMPSSLPGVEYVTNPSETIGGRDPETDDELRERAKDELSAGSGATAPALINAVQRLDGVTSVTIFVNDDGTDTIGNGGTDGFELIVAGGNDTEIGQAILNTKAAGDSSYGGYNGSSVNVTADLPNGQTQDITFSRPTEVQIYVDATLDVTDEYKGDEAVADELVTYIGGLLSSGNELTGLNVGDDVIYNELIDHIMSVAGVYDVTDLTVGTSASPTGSANVAIADSDVAVSDATDGSITLTANTVN